jgi:hypothetical protein
MAPAIDTPLGRALRAHREKHEGCNGCDVYLKLATVATEERAIQEGPVAPYRWLSIREAEMSPRTGP